MATYIKPNAIKDASIEGIKIKDGAISSSKIDETVASKNYVDALEARATNAVQITYSELKSLRDAGNLVPGTQYRITDYQCTTTQEGTKSAGHVFDIIVTADDESTLNEEARAALHTGDTYFANSNLSAWKIWYCLDNDTNRFAWADATETDGNPNGKGVIYRMIDEFYNDAPYDFKNIQFTRYKITSSTVGALVGQYAISDIDKDNITVTVDTSTPYWCYTFSTNSLEDASLNKDSKFVFNNIISRYYYYGFNILNNIVFNGATAIGNRFGVLCSNNTFGEGCQSNIFEGCSESIFGKDFQDNTVGDNCHWNIFGNSCQSNTFGTFCQSNTFGSDYHGNIFGNHLQYNTFGDSYYSNTFGEHFQYNTFGSGHHGNTFGNNCGYNNFGDDCHRNTFGNDCGHIKFASDSAASTKYNYYQYNHFGDGCQYILFKNADAVSSSYVQNYKFAQGLQGTDSAYLTIDGVRNRTYETYISKDTDGTIKESVIAEKLDKVIEISYNDLVTLRGSSKLVPGQQYRITDYTCTTAQEGTRSAGHQFDVIVTADSKNKLNENARAIQHTDDTYFANSKLESWELKYCLDNDTTRFAWADETNGKGVIYWMKDEYDNECPYDFKNIQFKRYAVTNVTSTKLTSDALNDLKNTLVKDSNGGLYFATKDSYGNFVPSDTDGASYEINENDSNWYYTFQGISSNDGSTINKMYDLTVETFKLTDECISSLEGGGSGADTEDYCRENKIEQFNQEYFGDDIYYKGRQILNNIVFIGGLNYCYYNEENSYWEYNTSSIYGNRFGVNCNSNTFGNYCQENTFGNDCSRNTFGNYFQYNTFGNYCGGNTFGNDCQYNTFGDNCGNNTFVGSCSYNTFGNNCNNNTFGNDCNSNTFGNDCNSNTFGNRCSSNTFGNYCGGNTFGSDCNSNTFGNYCQENTFGNIFQLNTFGNDCGGNTFGNYFQESQFGDGVQYFSITNGSMTTKPTASYLKNYIRWLIVENGVRYVNAYVTGSTSPSSYCQNVRICLGIQGVNNSNRKTFDITSCINSKLNNVYQPANSQTTSV